MSGKPTYRDLSTGIFPPMDGMIVRTSMKQFDNDIKSAKQMRLPWWGVVCLIVATLPIIWLFDHFGRFDLARPALYSIGMLGIAIAIKWKLRGHLWFWVTMTVIVALHAALILLVPWGTKWVPAIVIIPIGIADLYAMLAILSIVGKFVERPRTSER